MIDVTLNINFTHRYPLAIATRAQEGRQWSACAPCAGPPAAWTPQRHLHGAHLHRSHQQQRYPYFATADGQGHGGHAAKPVPPMRPPPMRPPPQRGRCRLLHPHLLGFQPSKHSSGRRRCVPSIWASQLSRQRPSMLEVSCWHVCAWIQLPLVASGRTVPPRAALGVTRLETYGRDRHES